MISKFKLGAIDWSIEINNDKLDDKKAYGECNFHSNKILLQDKSDGKDRHPSAVEQTMYHEIVHAILDTLGEHELSADEEFVQRFSLLLHQFENTKE